MLQKQTPFYTPKTTVIFITTQTTTQMAQSTLDTENQPMDMDLELKIVGRSMIDKCVYNDIQNHPRAYGMVDIA